MANQIGAYSLYICLFASIYLIYKSYISSKDLDKTINQTFFATLSVQLSMTILSFFTLVYAFVFSEFSNITVFNNSHTLKPLFYKISGTWGNHEGSLLLWLLVLTIFLFVFFVTSKNMNARYRTFTILFQEIIILGFLLFILFTSNPF